MDKAKQEPSQAIVYTYAANIMKKIISFFGFIAVKNRLPRSSPRWRKNGTKKA